METNWNDIRQYLIKEEHKTHQEAYEIVGKLITWVKEKKNKRGSGMHWYCPYEHALAYIQIIKTHNIKNKHIIDTQRFVTGFLGKLFRQWEWRRIKKINYDPDTSLEKARALMEWFECNEYEVKSHGGSDHGIKGNFFEWIFKEVQKGNPLPRFLTTEA
jgi:hypothetical protein